MGLHQLQAAVAIGIYMLAACLAAMAAYRRSGERKSFAASVWLAIGVLLLGLAFWRYIDGDTMLREAMRALFDSEGLYGERREVQGPVIAVVIVTAVLVLATALRMRELGRLSALDKAGWIVALGFAFYCIIRAISFHPIDRLIYQHIGPVNLNRILDIGAAIFLGAVALMVHLRIRIGEQRTRKRPRKSGGRG